MMTYNERGYARRSTDVRGFVNFPVQKSDYEHTQEGGMTVLLLVVDPYDKQFSPCFGPSIHTHLHEVLIGDDQPATRCKDENCSSCRGYPDEMYPLSSNEHEHFPKLHDDLEKGVKYISREYLTAIHLGSTGWSGYNLSKDRYWSCVYDDLTENGKQLYDLISLLYRDCTLILQTWLDT